MLVSLEGSKGDLNVYIVGLVFGAVGIGANFFNGFGLV